MHRMVMGWVAVTLACLFSNTARAQDALLNDIYGLGVHAFYANDYSRAHQLFTSAIEQGSQDPRVYYFRGLTYQTLGRPDEAASDFGTGAELELTTVLAVPIGQSLQRVQGSQRMAIEQYRREARLAVRAQQMAVDRVRYEERQRGEAGVRRDPEGARLPAFDLPATRQPDPTDPFDAEALVSPQPTAPAAPPVRPAPAEDLFGDAPAQPIPTPAVPDEDDPFGAPEPAVPLPVPVDDDDPFGAPAAPAPAPAVDDDLFGEPAAPAPMPAAADDDDPFGEPAGAAPPAAAAADDDDPFADDKAVDAVPAPAPAMDDDDPFGDDPAPAADAVPAPAPAPAMDDDDPFADPFGN